MGLGPDTAVGENDGTWMNMAVSMVRKWLV
jgi:hypothetical protein